jgi:hypothetical protein
MGGTKEVTFDCNPNAGAYGFFSLQPLKNYRAGKVQTLATLVELGHTVRMIGDGESDLADPSTGVVIGLVGNTQVAEGIIPSGCYRTPLGHALGATDIMRQMLSDETRPN